MVMTASPSREQKSRQIKLFRLWRAGEPANLYRSNLQVKFLPGNSQARIVTTRMQRTAREKVAADVDRRTLFRGGFSPANVVGYLLSDSVNGLIAKNPLSHSL